MWDAFVAHAYLDHEFAAGLSASLTARGLALGMPVSLGPEMPLVKAVDDGLLLARHAVVVVSREFLHNGYSRRDLDLLAGRERTVCLLYGVDERVVCEFSTKLAVAAFPGTLAESLVRLLRCSGGTNGQPSHQ